MLSKEDAPSRKAVRKSYCQSMDLRQFSTRILRLWSHSGRQKVSLPMSAPWNAETILLDKGEERQSPNQMAGTSIRQSRWPKSPHSLMQWYAPRGFQTSSLKTSNLCQNSQFSRIQQSRKQALLMTLITPMNARGTKNQRRAQRWNQYLLPRGKSHTSVTSPCRTWTRVQRRSSTWQILSPWVGVTVARRLRECSRW